MVIAMTEKRTLFGFECRKVPGYEWYWISECGTCLVSTYKHIVRRMKPRDHNGYLSIEVQSKNRERVHRMVAMAWLEGYGEVVNHKDGQKHHNHASNLEWCSAKENTYHALRNGLHNTTERPIIGVHTATGDGIWIRSKQEAIRMGFKDKELRRCLGKPQFSHHGYRWSYAEAA